MIKNSLSLEHFRYRLSQTEALPQLVVIGILSGVSTGLLIILFRLVVDLPQHFLLPSGIAEDFESLPPFLRVLLPIAGSLFLFLILYRLSPDQRRTGPVHVLERMGYHQGHMPVTNMLVQFWGAAAALISGHSVGREGPSIHLGAGCSSLLGHWLKLPNNSIRILVGCGTAAAIAAAFNTPLAGVVFAMEVVMLEYTVIGFTPVVVAAVSADLMVRLTLGSEIDLAVPPLQIESFHEIPFVMLVGFCIGCLAAGFNRLMVKTVSFSHTPLLLRLLLAGVLVGGSALIFPQVMGVGYDTLTNTLQGEYTLPFLLGLLLVKLLLTPIILGLGVPGGLIGPSFFIGAIAGAALGMTGALIAEQPITHVSFYAMLGMGAMMGALLNAPLAALIALLELTGNPNIILPGMIAIVISNLTVRYVFNLPSVFVSSLHALGLDYRHEPITQALSSVAVSSLMSRDFIKVSPHIERRAAEALQNTKPDWLLACDNEHFFLLEPTDLVGFLKRAPEAHHIDLVRIPALRKDLEQICYRSTLHQALSQMNDSNIDALAVTDINQHIIGILTREQIETSYRNNLKP
ncbi:MAG: chloride channel protein [Pontibacterium sp.]